MPDEQVLVHASCTVVDSLNQTKRVQQVHYTETQIRQPYWYYGCFSCGVCCFLDDKLFGPFPLFQSRSFISTCLSPRWDQDKNYCPGNVKKIASCLVVSNISRLLLTQQIVDSRLLNMKGYAPCWHLPAHIQRAQMPGSQLN